MQSVESFDVKFTSKEVTAWGGLALLKKMLHAMAFGQTGNCLSPAPTGATLANS
jgi:hypothetical protein